MSSISSSTSNGGQHQKNQNWNFRSGTSSPPHEELNYGPYPPGYPAGGVRPRPPLLSTPTSISASPQPLGSGVPDGSRPAFPPPSMNGPALPGPRGAAGMGRNVPFPPPHFPPPPAGDFHHFNNGGSGGGGGGGGGGVGGPMMYHLSQPMYPQRAVLIPRLPLHGGLSQQAMPYPGPNQPPQVLVPPHTMYNPYLAMGPNYPPPMYQPGPLPGPVQGLHPGNPETAFVEPSITGVRDEERKSSSGRSSPGVSPRMGVASSAVSSSSNRSSSPFQTITSPGTVERNAGRGLAGRKNYRVARSPGKGHGGDVSTSGQERAGSVSSSGTEGGIARGMSSTSGGQSVEVKVVSAAPIPASRVETPVGEFWSKRSSLTQSMSCDFVAICACSLHQPTPWPTRG